ncbi:MAG: sodium/proline symporter [Oscillospiraceae bacterium]|jgi:sodium/proline symporter|nr:sodium/proline symporter [Oscillospiraceae bacterium]
MTGEKTQLLLAMALYMAAILGIGIYTARRANRSSADYFIGGRSLGPWVAAMSAEASDMSGWLLMGVPGVAYWCGLADAFWTCLGLLLGTYFNWLLVAKRLRRYSVIAGNAITLPEFFSNRFREKKPVLLVVASIFILVFFAVYVGSCFVTGGKLFSTLFGMDYKTMMLIGAIFVIAYTFLGGFLAESVSDLMQAIIMVAALLAVFVVGGIKAGGIGAIFENVRDFPGFLEFFSMASPVTDDAGKQLAEGAKPMFGDAASYGWLTIISTMSWGLGYFGMPQVLLRFMAIRKVRELGRSRRIATVWCAVSMAAAIGIGLMVRALYPTADGLQTAGGAEGAFISAATNLFPVFLAGIIMSGILAAAMSSADSYLLIATSALSKNIFQGLFHRRATDKQVMLVSRVALLLVAAFGVLIALNDKSEIFKIVSFAWAGFGATFGPLMLLSLFWKRTTMPGALAGMLGGGGMVFFYKFVIRTTFEKTVFNIYELLPAFLFSALLIVLVSLLTKKPDAVIAADFEKAKDAANDAHPNPALQEK